MAFWSHGGTRRVSIYGCWHMLQQMGDVVMCGGAALKTSGAGGRVRPAVCGAICLLQSGSDPNFVSPQSWKLASCHGVCVVFACVDGI